MLTPDKLAQATDHLKYALSFYAQDSADFLELRVFGETESAKASHADTHWIASNDDEALQAAAQWAEDYSKRGFGVYLGYNPRVARKGTKENVTHVCAAYADLDHHKIGKTIQEVITYVESEDCPLAPSMIVCSGRGSQAIYFFDSDDRKATWRIVQEGIYETYKPFNSDRAVVTDESRVLRLSPFPNQKDGRQYPTYIAWVNPIQSRLKLDDLMVSFGGIGIEAMDRKLMPTQIIAADGTITIRMRGTVPEEVNEGGSLEYGGRNNVVFTEAAGLYRKGYHMEEICALMEVFNDQRCHPPLTVDELTKTMQNVVKYVQPGNLVVPTEDETANVVMSMRKFRKQKFADPAQIVTGLYAGEIGLVQALPNAGKSTLMMNLAMSLAAGRAMPPFTEEEIEPTRVAYLDFENRETFFQLLVQRMSELNFDEHERELIEDNLWVSVDRKVGGYPLKLSTPGHLAMVKKSMKDFQPALIIVDTLAEGFELECEASAPEVMAKVIMPMKALAGDFSAAVIIIHHMSKASENAGVTTGMMAGRGSSALPGAARLVLNIGYVRQGEDSKGEIIEGLAAVTCVKIKGRAFPRSVFRLDFDTMWYQSETAAATLETSSSSYMDILQNLRCPMSPGELVAVCQGEALNSPSLSKIHRVLRFSVKFDFAVKEGHGKYAPTQKLLQLNGGNVYALPTIAERMDQDAEEIPLSPGAVLPFHTDLIDAWDSDQLTAAYGVQI